MAHMIVGVDIAKNVMQVHWVDPDSGEIVIHQHPGPV
ncbi:hypothetical protein HDG38_002365 [Paraburkholderia sp. WSM4177]|nr:hypothetical protein [Paraburkholderia sp. WSM4177]MBB5485132.1 hypothetical protein [Paraburkholderia sp. WSM4180]